MHIMLLNNFYFFISENTNNLSSCFQRLAEDSNPAIAVAASKAIYELKKQWEIEEGDSWRFTMNRKPMKEADDVEDTN